MPTRWNFSRPGTAAMPTSASPFGTVCSVPTGVLVGGHVVLQYALAATVLVPLVPAKYFRRLFRLHVRERRHVVRALHHYRGRIASRFSAVVLGTLYPDVGRYLDIHWHA